jgi:carbon-monoxide dehydrogenase large subunit
LPEHQFRGRREDQRLVTGRGRYTSDHEFPGQVAGHFLRADRAHAKIVRIDIEEAKKLPGVLDVVTGTDIAATGWKGAPAMAFFKGVGGSSLRVPFRNGLAVDRVRFVGEPVALIVARTEAIAQDAAELVAVEYEDLPVYVTADAALAAGATAIHGDAPTNLAFDYEYGNRESTEPGFKDAAHVVRVALHAQRISGNPMEPKSCTALYDAATETYDVCIPTQGISDIKATLSGMVGLPPEKFRIISNDVGGAFGVRNEVYPEFLAVMLAAKRTGKPVKWLGTRSETISGDHQARAADLIGELALDARGKFLALRVEWLVNLGAFSSNAGPLINTVAAPTSSAMSLYKIGALHGRHRLVFTNTTPTTAYRGAGRPNVAYLWERLVEEAALVTGVNPVTLRRRNLLKKDAFPLKTLTGSSYDSADPARLLDTALEAADWDGFSARRKAAKKNGKLRGLGLALFLEPSGGMGKEQVEIRVGADGKLGMYSNAGPSGQGHETVFPALVAGVLGIPDDRIEMRVNDVATPKFLGTGTFGSRSLICHGAALQSCAKEIVEKGKKLAAGELEVAPSDVTFDKGQYRVTGTDLSISMKTLIEKNWGQPTHPLDTNTTFDIAFAYPSGAHVAEVEIDPDTGQLLSGTFMDYFMPHADNLPPIKLIDCGVPSPFNPLGAKGAGEAGATGSVPALANAVFDALKPLNVRKIEMPYTPHRIWRAIQDARG